MDALKRAEAGFKVPDLCRELDIGSALSYRWRGKPRVILCDNGPENVSGAVQTCVNKHEIQIECVQPGQPQKNACIERFNRTVRYDRLAQELFDTIDDLQDQAMYWMWHYNHKGPNTALGGITPNQRLAMVA